MSNGAPAAGDGSAQPNPVVTRQIAAEAALWVARLHGPGRSRAMELACLAWQARSAAHRHAFECCTDVWLEVPGVMTAGDLSAGSADAPETGQPVRDGLLRGRRAVLALAAAGVAAVAGVAWVFEPWHGGHEYSTGVGEMLSLVLDDGTRLSLNTDTRLRVSFSSAQRSISVDRGEAVFEVASDTARPFVVRVSGSEVVALGTVFAVRLDPATPANYQTLDVTLLEGRVSVRSAARSGARDIAPAQPLEMKQGQRVRLRKTGESARAVRQEVDQPSIDQLMAWQRSEAVFDGVPLADAVAEMNRYSRTPVALSPEVAQSGRRISGRFRTGDSATFAQAVAAVHGLALRRQAGRLELVDEP